MTKSKTTARRILTVEGDFDELNNVELRLNQDGIMTTDEMRTKICDMDAEIQRLRSELDDVMNELTDVFCTTPKQSS